LEEHLVHLEQVLRLLAQEKWQVKLSKGSFAQHKIAYLGYIISIAGVSTKHEKIVVVRVI
jgi:hypothetical protein